jgi:predicted RNA-binding Zn ribbon-like protein
MTGEPVTFERASSPPLFLGEHPALDFLNTVAAPADVMLEWLGSGEELLDWLVSAELVPAKVAANLRDSASREQLDAVAGRARALREWFRGFVQRRAGRPLTSGAVRALAPLNRLLARDAGHFQLEAVRTAAEARAPAGRNLQWRWERRWRRPDALLQPIAQAIGDLLCQADFRYVRRCEGCMLWFLDVSRGHQRRWCSMAVCGNRAKAAAYRASTQA